MCSPSDSSVLLGAAVARWNQEFKANLEPRGVKVPAFVPPLHPTHPPTHLGTETAEGQG